MFAAHFCQSEICNGGLGQFFGNSTGGLAPEAVEGFREIGQAQVAALIASGLSVLVLMWSKALSGPLLNGFLIAVMCFCSIPALAVVYFGVLHIKRALARRNKDHRHL